MSNFTDNTVLPIDLLGKADELIRDLSKDQLLWLGGYLSGLGLQNGQVTHEKDEIAVLTQDASSLTVLVGSHSGNSKIVAQQLQEQAAGKGIQIKVIDMADYKIKKLKDETNVVIVVSTHGEGEPTASAEELHRLLNSKRVGDLSGVSFAVVALGDSSYKNFCQTGIDFHDRLIQHGAKALADPVLLDVDFQNDLAELSAITLQLFGHNTNENKALTKSSSVKPVTGNGIFKAEVLDKILLNGKGSAKETYHIELSLEGSGLTYEPGDALEVFAVNDPKLVNAIIRKLQLSPEEQVKNKEEDLALSDALMYFRELTIVTLPVVKKLSAYVSEPDLNTLLDKRDELDKYLQGRDLLDVLNDFAFQLNAQELVDALRPLVPRAYSIASSQSEVDDEVHITVGAVRYLKNERLHEGVCSSFLADRLQIEDKVGVRIKNNSGFKLPDADRPVLMIGPGTGIAPFRSFIQERADQRGRGLNWLIFGDQHFETDFLYQAEWIKYRDKGVLNRIDVAFSRDQEEKIYVQHRLLENAKEVYDWLAKGAYIYVCGDKDNMAKDVFSAFIEILYKEGQLSPEKAEEKLMELRKSGRYQEDVY